MVRWKALLIAVATAVSCTADLPAPNPEAVTPNVGWSGEPTAVVIEGEAFYPQVEFDPSGREQQVNAGFQVLLEGGGVRTALESVSLVDYEHLQATVPAGLTAGTYDVVVRGPTGVEGTRPSGFTVSATRADRLLLSVDSLVHQVFETAWMDVALVDPEGDRVLSSLPVVVVVSKDGQSVATTFSRGGLEGQENLAAGYGIRGSLGPDGAARIGFAVESPDTVEVSVAPSDPESGVTGASVQMLVEPGDELALELSLPSPAFTTVAGAPFSLELALHDQFGNPVLDQDALVVLRNRCGSWVEVVEVVGVESVDVTLRTATGTAECPEDRIEVVAGPQGLSEPITVVPAAVARFEVATSPPQVVAGEALTAFLTPTDAFANVVPWTGSTLELSDSVDGVGAVECTTVGVPLSCSVESVTAAAGVVLTATDDQGTTGSSAPYTVVAGPPATLEVFAPSEVVAGAQVPVEVWVRDAWSNVVGGFTADDVVVTSPGDAPLCAASSGESAEIALQCQLYVARTDARLEATLLAPSLVGSSPPFAVSNGPLAAVTLDLDSGVVQAGDAVGLQIEATDAWGNAYVAQADAQLVLQDTTGTLTPGTVQLGSDGTANTDVVVTQAGSTQIRALQGGVELGRSAALAVLPAEGQTLVLTPEAPWVWVGDDVTVEVEVHDAFGNRADWAGQVALVTDSGLAPPVDVDVADGAGTATLQWAQPVLDEGLTGSGDGVSGSAGPLAVVEVCVEGPTASLSLPGGPTVCEQGGIAQVDADLSASTAGAAPLALYALWSDEGTVRSSVAALSVDFEQAGAHDLVALVADTAGCADSQATELWTGPPGEPVGPLVVAVGQGSLGIGTDTASLQVVGALDCAGDPAEGGQILLRSDRGSITGATATGTGLRVTLDEAGGALATLDASTARGGGLATVHAWSSSGSSRGLDTALFLGDALPPRVWSQEPAGDTGGTVDTVVLTFSEALDGGTVSAARFSVTGPGTTSVTEATLQGNQVTLTLSPAVDASLGTWLVTAAATLADGAGNALDGQGDGSASAWVGAFGDLPGSPGPVSSCAPQPSTFRPDGDDGQGEHADATTITLGTSVQPHWWVIEVLDAQGARVRLERQAAVDRSGTWTWDGRDKGARIVEAGPWTVTVRAEDTAGNQGAPCSAVVQVVNESGL